MHNDDLRPNTPTMTEQLAATDARSSPATDMELAVSAIWSEVLGLDHIGLHDNFLLLGGESLLATQVVSEIRVRLGCDISIRSIFVGTVTEVAEELESIRAGNGSGRSSGMTVANGCQVAEMAG